MGQFIIDMVNLLIEGLGNVMTWVLALLPPTPFRFDYVMPQGVWGIFTWLVPVNQFIAHFMAFLGIILLWYALRVILNWLKVIEN